MLLSSLFTAFKDPLIHLVLQCRFPQFFVNTKKFEGAFNRIKGSWYQGREGGSSGFKEAETFVAVLIIRNHHPVHDFFNYHRKFNMQ